VTTHLLDRTLRDFAAIHATGAPVPEGDRACDDDADGTKIDAAIRIARCAAD